MCSIPGLPKIGSSTTVQITRVNLNQQTVLVQFGGSLNNGQETRKVYQQLKKDTEVPRKRQHTFEGKPGEVCLVYEDRTWHRARILLKSEHEYKLFLIDDGKLLWASSEVLTKCPSNLCSLPPKVELCILANVSPLCIESAWSVAASKFIRSLCGKDISGCVQDVIMPSRIIILDIPSISKQMYELGFARKMPNEDFKSLIMHSLHFPRRNPSIQTDLVSTIGQQEHASDPEKLHQYLYPELLPGTVEIVTVTQVIHPLKIYCKLHVFSQELKKLSDQLHEYYEDSFSAQMPMLLYDGSPCATKGSDGKWYRSVLQQSTVSDVVKVFHVDYGIGDFVKLCNIRPLSPRFFRLPVVTYACALHGVIDKGIGWRTEQIDYLKSVVLDQILVGKFEHHSVNEGVYYITLYGNDNGNVNDTFGQREQCLSLPERICNDQTLDTLNKVAHKYMYERNVPVRSLNSTALAGCSDSLEDVTVARPSKTGKNLQSAEGRRSSNAAAAPPFRNEAYLSDLPSKILEAGYVSDIYVSHCNSPSSFFVQLTSDEDEIFSLLDKLNSAQLSDAQVELDLLQSGDLVVAEYPADGAWYRAVVQNKNDDKVQVQFIDFGNKATLLPLKIRQLGKQFLSTPMFSIQCTLEDGRKEKRDWTQEEIMTFKKAAGESGEKKIRCKFVRGDVSAWIVSLDLEEGPLFNAALKPGAQTESQMHCNEDTQPLAFKEPAVNQGQMVDAYASSIVGPNYFWCQFKNSEDLDKISLLAQEIGNSSQAKPIQPDQLCHRPCLALFSDQLWYRAQVINTHSKTVSVLFIDYGNESEIDLNLIKSLPTKLLESPPQAFLCQLEALGSVDGTWSDAAADKFFELLVDEPLKVTIQNTVMSSDLPDVPKYNVLVECNGIIVNDLMKDYWCDPKSKVCSEVTMDAKTKPTTGKDHFGVTSSETVQKDNVLNSGKLNGGASNDVNPELHSFDPQISQNKLVAAETQEQSITCSTLTAVVGKVMVPEISVQSLPQAADLPPRMIESGKVSEVYVSHINSLTSFFVQLVEDENTLFSLTELLNSHQPSENDEIHATSIQHGSLVKAMFPEDDSWYRAVVKDMTENGMIQVEFIDFGNEATVSLLKIRRLDEQLLSYPRYSIQCSCSLDDRFKAQKGMEQQIFLFKKIFGEAGENTLSCKFIKEDGITWEVKMTPCGITSDSSEKWDGLDFNASLVVSEPVKETFQLYMKPDVSLGQTVEAFASCVVGPDYFWCQFSNHETLDQITLVAQEYGNSSERQPIKLDDLDTGSPCLARFCDDQMWYRAQVIDKCTNTVSVLFVDFGNESETSEGSVKALPCDLLESPPQAFLCRLEGFDPSKGSWDSAATDNFYDLLVDKPLKLTVQCIDSTTDPNSPPYYVKVESPQYLVNELMTKFWIFFSLLCKSVQSFFFILMCLNNRLLE
uniref:Si:ch211-189e2.3 n=1 Tax=Cyprinus carpio TaxID=7962 RepID=A0A8C2KQE5_CYPCA